nr:hypothetical protein [Arthrobacter gallicola]
MSLIPAAIPVRKPVGQAFRLIRKSDMIRPNSRMLICPKLIVSRHGPSSITKPTPAAASARSPGCLSMAATEGCRNIYATAASEVAAAISSDKAVKK